MEGDVIRPSSEGSRSKQPSSKIIPKQPIKQEKTQAAHQERADPGRPASKRRPKQAIKRESHQI